MTTTTERPSATPTPTAARLRRPTWRDPRLLVGVVVVALSVALGSWAVSSAGRTVTVWAADGVLTPGEPVAADRLRTVEVRLGTEGDRYLHADETLPEDAVALRVVEPGELVPRSALGTTADLTVRAVAVPVTSGLSDRIAAGAVVDLWHVPPPTEDVTADPAQLVGGVTVAEVDEGSGTLVVGGPVTVHVLVPAADLPAVLGAVAGEGTIAVVPVGGSS